jgi:hypothetical protein
MQQGRSNDCNTALDRLTTGIKAVIYPSPIASDHDNIPPSLVEEKAMPRDGMVANFLQSCDSRQVGVVVGTILAGKPCQFMMEPIDV